MFPLPGNKIWLSFWCFLFLKLLCIKWNSSSRQMSYKCPAGHQILHQRQERRTLHKPLLPEAPLISRQGCSQPANLASPCPRVLHKYQAHRPRGGLMTSPPWPQRPLGESVWLLASWPFYQLPHQLFLAAIYLEVW